MQVKERSVTSAPSSRLGEQEHDAPHHRRDHLDVPHVPPRQRQRPPAAGGAGDAPHLRRQDAIADLPHLRRQKRGRLSHEAPSGRVPYDQVELRGWLHHRQRWLRSLPPRQRDLPRVLDEQAAPADDRDRPPQGARPGAADGARQRDEHGADAARHRPLLGGSIPSPRCGAPGCLLPDLHEGAARSTTDAARQERHPPARGAVVRSTRDRHRRPATMRGGGEVQKLPT